MKDYAGTPFQFQIAKKPYVLQPIGFGDIEKVTGFGEVLKNDPAKGIREIRALLASKSNTKTADAIMSGLGPREIFEMIQDWAGLTPGESQTSGDA